MGAFVRWRKMLGQNGSILPNPVSRTAIHAAVAAAMMAS